jgi:hypothetical protein
VNGKNIETFVTCSKTGTVTSEKAFSSHSLTTSLKRRQDGSFAFGVPYGTYVWQVSDSSEQNGAFKMALTEAKQHVLEKEMHMQLERTNIECHTIVGLVHYAWEKSFAWVRNNKKATSAQG